MDILQGIKDKLAPLGLYDLEGDTLPAAEAAVYAAELQRCSDLLDELCRERFAATATGRGLQYYERALGLSGLHTDTAARQKAAAAALFIRHEANRLADMERLKDILGVEGSFTTESNRLVFDCDEELSPERAAVLQRQLGRFAPAWGEAELVTS